MIDDFMVTPVLTVIADTGVFFLKGNIPKLSLMRRTQETSYLVRMVLIHQGTPEECEAVSVLQSFQVPLGTVITLKEDNRTDIVKLLHESDVICAESILKALGRELFVAPKMPTHGLEDFLTDVSRNIVPHDRNSIRRFIQAYI